MYYSVYDNGTKWLVNESKKEGKDQESTIRNPKRSTLANNEDPDEMPHNAAFHQGLHCLLNHIQTLEKEMQH